MTQQNTEYELEYWKTIPKEKALDRYKKFVELIPGDILEEIKNCKRVADIGCGPYGGMFNEIIT